MTDRWDDVADRLEQELDGQDSPAACRAAFAYELRSAYAAGLKAGQRDDIRGAEERGFSRGVRAAAWMMSDFRGNAANKQRVDAILTLLPQKAAEPS